MRQSYMPALLASAVLVAGAAGAQETTRPNDPLQPIDPTEPTQPIEPEEPPDPMQPPEGMQPVDPMQPTDPSDPGEAAGQPRGIGQSGQTSQDDIEKLSCEDYLVLSPDDVERVYYWYGGYLAGKRGEPGWRYETVMEWNDAIVTRCTGSKSERVIDIIEDISASAARRMEPLRHVPQFELSSEAVIRMLFEEQSGERISRSN